MSKTTKNSLIAIVIILLVFTLIYMYYQNFKAEPMNANSTKDNIIQDANTGLENMLNTIFENNENTEEQNIEKIENNNTEIESKKEIVEEKSDLTSKEAKAISLVKEEWKKQWGSLEGVSFNVSIQSNGKYGVTVYETTTTQSIQFYIVDVDTEIVKEK